MDRFIAALKKNSMASKTKVLSDALKDGDVVLVMDVSGSMEVNVEFTKNVLTDFKEVLVAVGMDSKIHLVFYSDYDVTKVDTKNVARDTIEPDWFTLGIKASGGYDELPPRDQQMIDRLVAKYPKDPFAFMSELKLPGRPDIKQMFELALIAYVEMHDISTDDQEVAGGHQLTDDEVFKVAGSGIDDIISALDKVVLGNTIKGSGGDIPEAGLTVAMAIAEAAANVKSNTDIHVNMIFLTDAAFHVCDSTEARRERAYLESHGLPGDIPTCMSLLERLGHRIILCTPRNTYADRRGTIRYPPDRYDITKDGSFIQMLTKFSNCDAFVHPDFMRKPDVFMAVLLNAFSVLMSGIVQQPWNPSTEEIALIKGKIGGTDADTIQLMRTLTNAFREMRTTVNGDVSPSVSLPRINTGDKETNQKIVQAFVSIMNKHPVMLCMLKFLSPIFYKAKSSVSEADHKAFTDFMSKMAKKDRNTHAAVNAIFVESRLNNRHELEDALEKFYTTTCPNPLTETDRVLIFDGEPLPRDTFVQLGQFLTEGMIKGLKVAMKCFRVVTLKEAGELGRDIRPDVEYADRGYLPLKILAGTATNLHLVWSLALNNETMPPRSCAFKVATIIVAQGAGLDTIVHLRMAAVNFLRANYKKYLALFVDDKYQIPDDRNPMETHNWWFSPLALNLLIKVLETIQPEKHLVDRANFALRVIRAIKPLNDQLPVKVKGERVDAARSARLLKCPSGEWMPETLFIKRRGPPHGKSDDPYACPANTDCVYCEGVHGEFTDEGRDNRAAFFDREKRRGTQYHMDGSPQVEPSHELKTRGINNVCMDDDMDTVCSSCKRHYSVVDGPQDLADGTKRGRGNNAPRCFNCRRVSKIEKARREKNPAVYRTCRMCKAEWVFGTSAKDWICVYCEHGATLGVMKIFTGEFNITIRQLLAHPDNADLLQKYAANFGLTSDVMGLIVRMDELHASDKTSPRFHKEPQRFLGQMRSPADKTMTEVKQFPVEAYGPVSYPAGCKINSVGEWPYPTRTIDDPPYNVTNMNHIINGLMNIRTQRLRGECDLGLCDAETHNAIDLVSLCGECTFRACKFCVRSMTQNRPGTIIPVARLSCPCGRAICEDTMHKIGRHDQLILKEAQKALKAGNTQNRIALCCGSHRVETLYGKKTGRVLYDCSGVRARNLPPFNGVCGADNPDDNTEDYRCPTCLEKEELYQQMLLEELRKKEQEDRRRKAFVESEEDIEIIKQSYPSGTILRRCPKCKVPIAFTWGCAHMTCGNPMCRTHWCWLCGLDCKTTAATYRHMNEREHAHDEFHRDTYNVRNGTSKITNKDGHSEIIECTGPKDAAAADPPEYGDDYDGYDTDDGYY